MCECECSCVCALKPANYALRRHTGMQHVPGHADMHIVLGMRTHHTGPCKCTGMQHVPGHADMHTIPGMLTHSTGPCRHTVSSKHTQVCMQLVSGHAAQAHSTGHADTQVYQAMQTDTGMYQNMRMYMY